MEELRSTEVLDKEIRSDSVKKAEKILAKADESAFGNRLAASVRTKTETLNENLLMMAISPSISFYCRSDSDIMASRRQCPSYALSLSPVRLVSTTPANPFTGSTAIVLPVKPP